MPGYKERVVRIPFKDLTEDGEPELYVSIKNPKTQPVDALTPQDVAVDATGQPIDPELAKQRSREIIAQLVVGWRMYDATDTAIDADGEPLDQQPLPLPATPDLVAKLPMEAIRAINEKIMEAVAPKSNQDPPTSTT